jgi:integrase
MPAPKHRVPLTDRFLKSLRVDARGQFMDAGLRNFGLRVSPEGRKVFFVRYSVRNQTRRQTIGIYPTLGLADARTMARDILARVARGEDPQQERLQARHAPTFADLAADYVERHARREKRRWKEDVRILDKDLLPAWRHLPAGEIASADVRRILDAILERGSPIMANRTRALISRVFNFGIDRELVDHNPAARVRPPAREQSRQVVLSDAQLRTLWALWEAERSITGAVFQILLVTAQREREVLTMRWQDLDGPWWCIPPGVVKNKLAHRVHLAPLALAIIDRLRPLTGRGTWVFASPRKLDRPVVALNNATERFRAVSGLHDWNPHDLRRTAATNMTRIGISRLVVGKILNHADPSVTAIYDRASYEPEVRDALCRWASHLESTLAIAPLAPPRPTPTSAAAIG